MSRFFKSAAFPILIVVVLAFFAQKLISTGDTKAPPTYGQFVSDLQHKGDIKTVDLRTKDNVVAVTQVDGKKYETGFTDQGVGRPEQAAAGRQGRGQHPELRHRAAQVVARCWVC